MKKSKKFKEIKHNSNNKFPLNNVFLNPIDLFKSANQGEIPLYSPFVILTYSLVALLIITAIPYFGWKIITSGLLDTIIRNIVEK